METENSTKSFREGVCWQTRVTHLITGIVAMNIVNFVFDYVLYPFVIYRLGVLVGGAIMAFVALLACLVMIKFYDWSKHDWLGIETVKALSGYDGVNKIGRLTSWMLKRSKPVIFFFLSLKFDAFVTMVYFRQGAYSGMNKKDWHIFTGSILVSNLYWVFVCCAGISLFQYIRIGIRNLV